MSENQLDILLGHDPDGYSFQFIEEGSEKKSSSQKWPIVPAVGDEINLRNGIEWIVTRRRVHYDSFLTIEVFVRQKFLNEIMGN